jgi:hypothetical protein
MQSSAMRTPLAALALVAACTPTRYRADIGAAMVEPSGDIALQNSAGTLNLGLAKNDLEGDLDLGEQETSPYLRLEVDWGPQRVRASGFGFEDTGSGLLANDFGDLLAGSAVGTSIEFFNVSAAWSYDLVPGESFRVGPGLQFGFYSLDVSAQAVGFAAFERVSTDVLVPELFVAGEADFGWGSLVAEIGWMEASLRDASGRYWDVDALVRVHPASQIELFLGYRYILMDADGLAASRDFAGDVNVSGWLVGGGVRF